MATKTDIPSSSTFSLPPFRKFTYDVFLSFRGEDTRKNFTDHLYAALKRNGIHTFRDDEELERGKSIAPELVTAIEESRYVIVVLSRNYANSSWCLDEIAKIVECMKETVVLPVFYDVDPYEVRKQKGHFERAFSQHEEAFKDEPDKVTRWRRALSQVANLSGWHLRDGYESKVIGEIVEKIFTELNERISTSEGLVGMDSHLQKMLSYLDIGRPDVRIIGICGMGGIGKTTIAHVVSQRIKAQFEGNSFLENIKDVIEKQGPVHLQEQLLSNLLKCNVNVQNTEMGKDIIKHRLCNRRVLIVLDDVDQDEQLEALCVGKWFGPGSRIILTSRDEHLLNRFEVDEAYKVNPLTDAEALQLFSLKAFKKDQLVGEDFLKLSKEFLKYAGGLPLAIKVLGSSLHGRRIKLWSSQLDNLKKNPVKKIIGVLKVSFDGLEETEKKTFLDIACFFKGDDRERIIRILEGSDDHCPDNDIEVLMEKSLVTLFGRKLWMHDLILELGREIVREECPGEPGKRSRLWVPKEIIHVLDRNKATSAIESILLQGQTKDDVVHSINDSFSNMDRLRLLIIRNVEFSGNIKYLSNELQYLEWRECPLNSFPSDFHPDNLVELRMPSSRIKQLWKGNQGWRMLLLIDLSGSQYLTSTPDFTQVPDLLVLNLEDCTSLVEVHPSLGFLKKLCALNMRNCNSVESIPPFTSLESLTILDLSLCSRLKMFPKIEGNMERLLELYLDGTSIEELPPSVERLTGLTMLSLSDCSKLVEIPKNLNCMESLEQLNIGGTAIRDSSFLVFMKNLKSLSCQGCKGDAPKSLLLPASLSSLTSLTKLDLSYCNLMDGDIPDDLSSLISLRELNLSGNCFVRLPESFSQLSKLQALYLMDCRQLELVPKKLPSSLQFVHAEGCTSLMDFPNQIKVLTSVESGVITINSLDSSAFGDTEGYTMSFFPINGEESEQLLIRNTPTEEVPVVRLTLPSQVYLNSNSTFQSMSHRFIGLEVGNEIPEWCDNTSTSNHISIPMGVKKWKGVATCAVFSVNNTTADVDFSNYRYQITLETDVVSLEPFVVPNHWQVYGRVRPISDMLLIYYEPRSSFPKPMLNVSTMVGARFETNNPFVVVQKCGIRLAYEQDAGWFMLDEFFTYQHEAVVQSGWVSRGDKCLNWEKFIPPSEEEYPRHVLRKNIESVLPRLLEASNLSTQVFQFNLSGSPAWSDNMVGFFYGMPAGHWYSNQIEIPQNLPKSKKWMGFAVHTSIAQEVIAEEEKENIYRVCLGFRTGVEVPTVGEIGHIRSSHDDQLLVVYIPRAQLPETLFADTSTTQLLVSLMTDSSHAKFRTIGVRVVYQQDIQGLADAIIQCMQKENSLQIYNKWVVKKWIELIRLQGGHLEGISNPKERDSKTRREKEFELHSQKYRNWDWSASMPVHCNFYGAEISKWKWFMHIKQGNSAEIPLPPSLLDDANWLGIAICAFSRLCPNDQDSSLGRHISNPKSDVVTCRLDCDGHVLYKWRPFTKFDAPAFAKDVTWFLYVPRSDKWLKSWRQCKLARATFSWSSQCLAVQSCALGLVYNKDVEHLVHTLTSCELP
ncbi:hypothetical protein M0R45_001193 [Rubus argutus]|uniref:ADP-ribosyl cyclase/cyclic ADP-ribose hydrolase n=1 Tax=Rubus argutus TaxID=59490 RepID=A0AAW1VNP2_RUBAR